MSVVNWNCPVPDPASSICWAEAWLAPCCCWIMPPWDGMTETSVDPGGLPDADMTLEGGKADKVKVWGPPLAPCKACVLGDASATETRFPPALGNVI